MSSTTRAATASRILVIDLGKYKSAAKYEHPPASNGLTVQ